jgi:hypothetical protein
VNLLIKEKIVRDPEVIADAFNTYFLTITDKLGLHQEGRSDAISFLRKFPGINTIPNTEIEMKSIIHSLKAKNFLGYDGITNKILKVCASLISHPLTHIYNHSLFTEIFSDCLKISVVGPLYKKTPWLVVRKRTIPTERPPLVSEASANFCG